MYLANKLSAVDCCTQYLDCCSAVGYSLLLWSIIEYLCTFKATLKDKWPGLRLIGECLCIGGISDQYTLLYCNVCELCVCLSAVWSIKTNSNSLSVYMYGLCVRLYGCFTRFLYIGEKVHKSSHIQETRGQRWCWCCFLTLRPVPHVPWWQTVSCWSVKTHTLQDSCTKW